MVSKTAMLERIKALDWRGVQAGMDADLLAVRDPALRDLAERLAKTEG